MNQLQWEPMLPLELRRIIPTLQKLKDSLVCPTHKENLKPLKESLPKKLEPNLLIQLNPVLEPVLGEAAETKKEKITDYVSSGNPNDSNSKLHTEALNKILIKLDLLFESYAQIESLEDFFSGATKDDNFKVIIDEIKKCKEIDSSFVKFDINESTINKKFKHLKKKLSLTLKVLDELTNKHGVKVD